MAASVPRSARRAPLSLRKAMGRDRVPSAFPFLVPRSPWWRSSGCRSGLSNEEVRSDRKPGKFQAVVGFDPEDVAPQAAPGPRGRARFHAGDEARAPRGPPSCASQAWRLPKRPVGARFPAALRSFLPSAIRFTGGSRERRTGRILHNFAGVPACRAANSEIPSIFHE